jgi:hypothetical protein
MGARYDEFGIFLDALVPRDVVAGVPLLLDLTSLPNTRKADLGHHLKDENL